MTAQEQASFMLKHHKTKDKALIAHTRIMANISGVYKSIEEARIYSPSYKHLEEVKQLILESK